ncbi:hypothetical protein ACFXHA_11955 [Nocardia sp. NPDC059240]|uniref:hypothetical protein n=1 Tax=Nocardia sp. NPDC059240 TaxID=3346786 RepID=UPI0036C2F22C
MGSVSFRGTAIARCLPAVLAAVAAVLATLFVVGPRILAGPVPGGSDDDGIGDAFRTAFLTYWQSDVRTFPPSLQAAVDYWFRYHVAKAVFAALALIVLAALATLLWKSFLNSASLEAGRRIAGATAAVFVTACTLASMLLVLANIQGALAPFSSLLPMLMDDESNPDLATAIDQARTQADAYPSTRTQPATQVMIDDFAWYHLIMAVLTGLVAVAALAAIMLSWRRFRRTDPTDRSTRRTLLSFTIATLLLTLTMLVVATANALTTATPAPALAALLNGGW